MTKTSQHTFSPFRALLWKEWQEQSWRFYISAFTLNVLFAGMLQAQIIPQKDTIEFFFEFTQFFVVFFLAASPVASEKMNKTWELLIIQPITKANILQAKWIVSILQFLGIYLLMILICLLMTDNSWFVEMKWNESIIQWHHIEELACAFAFWSCLHFFLFFFLSRAFDEATSIFFGFASTTFLIGHIFLLSYFSDWVKEYAKIDIVSFGGTFWFDARWLLICMIWFLPYVLVPLFCFQWRKGKLLEKWIQ